MECYNDKCACSSICSLINSCVIEHPLFKGFTESVKYHIVGISPQKREGMIIDILQKFKPPKVSGAQIDRYYSLLKHQGINLDRSRIPKKQQAFHQKFKSIQTKKKRNIIHLKPDTSYDRRRKKKAQLISQRLEREAPVILPPNINEIVSQMLNEPEPNFHYI